MSARRRRACAAKGHGKRREHDEGDADDTQRLTETRSACGREGEGDKSEEAMVHTGRDCAATTTAQRGSKRRGKRAKAHGDDEAELVDKLGRARASRSCATVAKSGETTDLACIAPWSPPTSRALVVN